MSNPRYPEEFKIEAVKQVTERGLPVAEVAARLGMSTHHLYALVNRYSPPNSSGRKRTISTLSYFVCVLNSSA